MLGLTQRTSEPARTDTLLLMNVDPSRHVIHMLSVPRDLWVGIPGYGYGKLAIPYEIGGPRLTASFRALLLMVWVSAEALANVKSPCTWVASLAPPGVT
jgi:hypothetical protein